MKKNYTSPKSNIHSVQPCQPLASSNDGPGPGDQNNPGINSSRYSRRRNQWDDDEEEDF